MKRNQMTIEPTKPCALPSEEDMTKAFQVIDDWKRHWYQVLYFATPKLTEPRRGPFQVKQDPDHSHCMRVECHAHVYGTTERRSEFDFLIRPDDTDESVVAKCRTILATIAEEKSKVHQFACCPLAKHQNCVCAYAFNCELHGEAHIGTHD